MAVIHLITESGKDTAQYVFWENINRYVYSSVLNIIACGGILNVIPAIEQYSSNKDDIIIVNIDVPDDNLKVVNEVRKISRFIDKHPNCYLLGETCFEDTLLHFVYFREWLYSLDYRKDGYISSNANILLTEYLNNYKDWRMSDYLCNFLISRGLDINNCSVEKLAFHVLNHLTMYRAYFRVSKGTLGKCWICDCKDKNNCPKYRYYNGVYHTIKEEISEKCGLKNNKKDTDEKVNEIFRFTILAYEIRQAKHYLLRKGYTVAEQL